MAEHLRTDVLVIGGGLAGMSAAYAAAEAGAGTLVMSLGRPNSVEVVGFNVPLLSQDSPEQLEADTLRAGERVNSPQLVQVMARGIGPVFRLLEQRGLDFRRPDGTYPVRLAADSRVPRTVYDRDETGPRVMHFLATELKRMGVTWLDQTAALRLLLTGSGAAAGAAAWDYRHGTGLLVHSRAVVLAAGGGCGIFGFHTNSPGMTGDSYGMALAAGLELQDMEFIQFEPFIMVHPPAARRYAIPTTLVTNEGGRVHDSQGEECLPLSAEGTLRGVTKWAMSRAMFMAVRAGRGSPHGGVFMDLRHVPVDVLAGYPRFLNACRKAGLDPQRDILEVAPAAHHCMGGVVIGPRCETAVSGLFAAGEAAAGLHGANRMAGNSGPDTLVFGRLAGQSAAAHALETAAPGLPQAVGDGDLHGGGALEQADAILARVGRLLWHQAGVVREAAGLAAAASELAQLHAEWSQAGPVHPDALRLRHGLLMARAVVAAAQARTESRGAHFRLDFPERDDERFFGNYRLRLRPDGDLALDWHPLGGGPGAAAEHEGGGLSHGGAGGASA